MLGIYSISENPLSSSDTSMFNGEIISLILEIRQRDQTQLQIQSQTKMQLQTQLQSQVILS